MYRSKSRCQTSLPGWGKPQCLTTRMRLCATPAAVALRSASAAIAASTNNSVALRMASARAASRLRRNPRRSATCSWSCSSTAGLVDQPRQPIELGFGQVGGGIVQQRRDRLLGGSVKKRFQHAVRRRPPCVVVSDRAHADIPGPSCSCLTWPLSSRILSIARTAEYWADPATRPGLRRRSPGRACRMSTICRSRRLRSR